MSRWINLLAIALCLPLLADENQAGDNPQSTPKGALTYFLQVGTGPNLDRATIFYYATTPEQKKSPSPSLQSISPRPNFGSSPKPTGMPRRATRSSTPCATSPRMMSKMPTSKSAATKRP